MTIQQRLLQFITRTNWILLVLASLIGALVFSPAFFRGVAFGGLIVTVNFHLLSRTLKKALTPPHLASHHRILAKYYVRFTISGVNIFLLIANRIVDPLGLFVGLSIVVASIMLATLCEVTKLILKEAV